MAVFSPLLPPVFILTLAPLLFPFLLGIPRDPTLHWWQQLPWAHSAPGFREQVLASQQGFLQSWKTVRCSRVHRADLRLALVCSHTQSNTIPPTLSHGAQHQLNASTAQPPSDGTQLLVLITPESLGCCLQLPFFF